MENFEPVIRNTVRAVIIRDQHILLLRKGSETRGEHFVLSGLPINIRSVTGHTWA